MGAFLAIVGLILAAADYFGFATVIETGALKVRDGLTRLNQSHDRFEDGFRKRVPIARFFGVTEVIAIGLALVGGIFFRGQYWGYWAVSILLLYVAVTYVISILFSLLLALIFFSKTRKGIIATLGLVLAAVGVWIEFAKG